MHPLITRAEIAQAAFDRFNQKSFDWWTHDCVALAKFTVMRAGHPNPLKGAREYRGEIGALRSLNMALRAAGVPAGGNLADLLDALGYARISPAAALPGDLVGLQADAPFGVALSVCMGNSKALGFALNPESGDHRCFVGEMFSPASPDLSPAVTAWSLF